MPEDSVFGKLGEDESVMFYQETNYSSAFPFLIKNEVLVSEHRVMFAEQIYLRWLLKRPFKHRWKCMDKNLVRGFDSGTLHPKLKDLIMGIVALIFAIWLLTGTGSSTYDLLKFLLMLPARLITWLGGPCESLGLCSQSIVKDPPTSRVISEGIAHVNQILQPGEVSQYSLLDVHSPPMIRNNKWPNRNSMVLSAVEPSEDAATVYALAATTGCHDLAGWIDHEGNNCTMYAKPAWPLACSNVAGTSAGLSSLAVRHDNQASMTSPLDACCSCGGSEHTGRGKAVKHLAQLLAYQFGELTGPTVHQDNITNIALAATQFGTDVHVKRLESLSTADLMALGTLLSTTVPVKDGSLTQDYASSILKKLYPDVASVHHYSGITLSPQQMSEVQEDKTPGILDKIWQYLLHFFGCIFRIICIIVPLSGLYKLYIWKSLYQNPRAFVVLRFHEHYFGQAVKVEPQKMWGLQYSGISHLNGFLMPDDLQRIAEFGRSLNLAGKEVAVKDNPEGVKDNPEGDAEVVKAEVVKNKPEGVEESVPTST